MKKRTLATGWVFTVMAITQAAPAETLFTDDFNSVLDDFLATWTVVETGDEQMTWSLGGSTLSAMNETGSVGNNQSIVFVHQVDTTGFENIFVSISYWANDLDDFEAGDFVRIQGYENNGPADAGIPIIENSTEDQWSPENNPPTTPTVLQANFGEYSFDDPNLWVAIEINTSLDRETIFVDNIIVSGQRIPKPESEYEIIILSKLTYAQDINECGHVVGYAGDENGFDRAYLYRYGSFIDLGTLGGTESWAYGINDEGLVVGMSRTISGDQNACLWERGEIIDLGTLGGEFSIARAINNSRQIVGVASTGNGSRAFLWQNGVMVDLGTLSSNGDEGGSEAYGINSVGEIVGQADTIPGGGSSAFLYRNSTMIDLEVPGTARDINDNSVIVGSYGTDTGYTHAFSLDYDNQVFTDLGTLGGNLSGAQAINNKGEIVGAAYISDEDIHAYVYRDSTMIDLCSFLPEDSPWDYLRDAKGMNESGQIVGIGRIEGQIRGFLLTPRVVVFDQPNLLINGSFENGPGNWPGPGSTDFPGWVVTRGRIDHVGVWQAVDGIWSLDLDGTKDGPDDPFTVWGGIAQTFETVVGGRYVVNFFMAGNPNPFNGPLVKHMRITAAGQSADFSFDATGRAQEEMGWEPRWWQFTATDTETTLEFYSLTAEVYSLEEIEVHQDGAVLDDVSVHLISVLCPNQAPEVDAGENMEITLPNSGQLDGDVWDDGLPTGMPLTLLWEKINGPSEVTFDPNEFVEDPLVTFTEAGVYDLRLTADDGELDANDVVTITVKPEGTLSGLVWHDLNGDGIQDEDEPGLEGVTVILFNTLFDFIDSDATDGAGNYQFDGLEPGDYIIEISRINGFAFSPQNQGDDDALDSDVSPLTGHPETISLGVKEVIANLDAGMYTCPCFGDVTDTDTTSFTIPSVDDSPTGGFTPNGVVNIFDLQLFANILAEYFGSFQFAFPTTLDFVCFDVTDRDADNPTGPNGVVDIFDLQALANHLSPLAPTFSGPCIDVQQE